MNPEFKQNNSAKLERILKTIFNQYPLEFAYVGINDRSELIEKLNNLTPKT